MGNLVAPRWLTATAAVFAAIILLNIKLLVDLAIEWLQARRVPYLPPTGELPFVAKSDHRSAISAGDFGRRRHWDLGESHQVSWADWTRQIIDNFTVPAPTAGTASCLTRIIPPISC